MGRYSSDSDDSYYSSSKRSKKKKSKSRRSRSRSSSEESYARKSKKSKKSKSKKRSRTRSRSSDRYRRRRSRSRDGGRGRSRSSSPHRPQHSSRRHRPRHSRSPAHRSPSSASRRYSHSPSRSPDAYKPKSESPPKLKEVKQEIKKEEEEKPSIDPCMSIPGFESMTILQQNDMRMQMALKAAAATDERLRKEGVLVSSSVSLEEQAKRAQAIAAIDTDAAFVQHTFLASRTQKPAANSSSEVTSAATHENAIFSNLPLKMDAQPPKPLNSQYTHPDSLMGPALYEDPQVKMDRWIRKLTAIRQRKLEGEAMT